MVKHDAFCGHVLLASVKLTKHLNLRFENEKSNNHENIVGKGENWLLQSYVH